MIRAFLLMAMMAGWACASMQASLMVGPSFGPKWNGPLPSYQLDGYRKTGGMVRFLSRIHRDGRGSFVRLDDRTYKPKPNEKTKNDSLNLRCDAFDSLIVKGFFPGRKDSLRIKADVMGNRWIFRAHEGNMTLFASQVGWGDYAFMQLDTGKVKPFSQQTVLDALNAKPASRKVLAMEKKGLAVSLGMVVVGLGMVVVGFVASGDAETTDEFGNQGTKFRLNPMVPVGFGLMLGSWIPYFWAQDSFEKAIRAYNRNP